MINLSLFFFFSSPELKALVSYSDRPFVRCPFLRLSVFPSVSKFLHFWLLQNHSINFNKTWHKSLLEGGDSKLFKWSGVPFSKAR
jgi:hypothetical protein